MTMQKSPVTRLIVRFIVLILLGVCSVWLKTHQKSFASIPSTLVVDGKKTELEKLKNAFENQQGNLQVKQSGKVTKLIRDDDHRPRHQRFVVQLLSGQQLLIAHNIDLAPKVEGLQEGAEIAFYGEYEWNNKGGVVHWTHRDPKGQHPDGWLLYGNRKYD